MANPKVGRICLRPFVGSSTPRPIRTYRTGLSFPSGRCGVHIDARLTGWLTQRPRPRGHITDRTSSRFPWAAEGQGKVRLGGGQRRTIFIQTEQTPNPDALKFLPNQGRLLPAQTSVPFIEYLSARATISPPYPSPLAAQLMAVEGVTSVFYGPDFITVTKATDASWAHVRPAIFSLITETVTSGQEIVNVAAGRPRAGSADNSGEGSAAAVSGSVEMDSLAYNESDNEVIGMIKELLDTRIRPAIQEDGGDIEYRGFEDGYVLLKLRGACRTCDSSAVTLKNGIEGMLKHYIEEVAGVRQVTDEEEEIALKEFEKFEERLKASQRL